MTEGGCTTHDAASLSAPLKLPDLLICISKHAAANFKEFKPMRPDWGMDLCVCRWVWVSGSTLSPLPKPWCGCPEVPESINVNVCMHVSLDGPPPTETCQVNIWRWGGAVVQRGHMPSEAVDLLQTDRARHLILRLSASEAAESHNSTKTAAFISFFIFSN